MTLDDFDYALPEELIAQTPSARRDESRLLVLGPPEEPVRHRRFFGLRDELRRGDLLVLNDTRVLPARLRGSKETGGRVELLLVERAGGDECRPVWLALLRASRPPRAGARIRLDGGLEALVLDRQGDEIWHVRLDHPSRDPLAIVAEHGRMPLPPYIRREEEDPRDGDDRERYQTVFARRPGAVAAPTAGLHFSQEMLGTLAGDGIEIAYLTLHVGLGTFLPLRAPRIEEHRMHAESYDLPEETAAAVEAVRRRRGRIVAVGTTVVRTLESRATDDGVVTPGAGRSELFIYPGFRFRVVDALLTNFHLPRSTLLLLVCAFAGRARTLEAYAEAVRERYRFFSYGDAMLVANR